MQNYGVIQTDTAGGLGTDSGLNQGQNIQLEGGNVKGIKMDVNDSLVAGFEQQQQQIVQEIQPAKTGQNKAILLGTLWPSSPGLRGKGKYLKLKSLTQLGNNVHISWSKLRDFNNVLSGSDGNGNAHVSSYEVRDFLLCCMDLGLVDLNSTGYHYTWTNNTVWSKIDRTMCTQSWFDSGLQASAKFLPGCLSDCSSCVVSLFELL
ncbi:hypothetical protein M9H77_25449 [Catharanthus roseus]|uniref:Uncharacterized protein n=1 Tax=Catharanthus roseus TaxID=4058 RepID=A0ACC0AAY0_CATRO|nr:hypothetical protein M9H77_25449 [Catharanthus roseus]